MKLIKKYFLFIILLSLFGCTRQEYKEKNNIKEENVEEIEIKNIYYDDNPIKIGLYHKNNGKYQLIDTYKTEMSVLKEIGVFSIILSDENEVSGSIKSLYNEYSKNYDNFNDYKIGYEIELQVKDGEVYKETILKPKEYDKYTFANYLLVWLYDDVNTTGWHSHLEPDSDMDETVMSSIKLMASHKLEEIVFPVKISVFSYLDKDFDTNGYYIGNSKYTMFLERK